MEPSPALIPTSASRDVVQSLKRLSVPEVEELARSVATAIASGSRASGSSIASLISATFCDAYRCELPASSVRSWWESVGLDVERAEALASASIVAAPAASSILRSEGAFDFCEILIRRRPTGSP
jgi:hypothetical protein